MIVALPSGERRSADHDWLDTDHTDSFAESAARAAAGLHPAPGAVRRRVIGDSQIWPDHHEPLSRCRPGGVG